MACEAGPAMRLGTSRDIGAQLRGAGASLEGTCVSLLSIPCLLPKQLARTAAEARTRLGSAPGFGGPGPPRSLLAQLGLPSPPFP